MAETVAAIDAFVIDRIKQDRLPDEIRGLPIGREALRTVLMKLPIEIGGHDPYSVELDVSEHSLMQPSHIHRRSYVISTPEFRQTWYDEYGNRFSAISTKGNNFSKPGILESATAPDDYIAYGLQESSVIGRVLRASQLLCENGISTEKILGLELDNEKMGLVFNLPSGGKIFIYPKEDHEPASHTVFNLVVDNIDEAVDNLKENGIEFEIYDNLFPGAPPQDDKGILRSTDPEKDGPSIAWFKDPAGNTIAVIEDK